MALAFGSGGINGTDFSPRSVSLGQSGQIPYINMNSSPMALFKNPTERLGARNDAPVQMSSGWANPSTNSVPMSGAPAQSTVTSPASPTLGAETVRATGTGPFDPTYRQNLATYAGGQFARPGGNLSFDPTGSLFGNPTGGGSAPVLGMPDSLVGQALGGNPFSFTPPAPTTPPPQDQFTDPLGFWKDQFLNNGRMFGAFNAL